MRPILVATFVGLVAPALALAAQDPARRIAEGFQELGMEVERSRCYGRVITGELEPERHAEAAEIVETAQTSEDVRAGVKDGGLAMVTAFLAASTDCDA